MPAAPSCSDAPARRAPVGGASALAANDCRCRLKGGAARSSRCSGVWVARERASGHAMKLSAASVVALALLGGCGGSGGDATEKAAEAGGTASATATATATQDVSGGETMSAAAWSRRVEAICVKSAVKAAKAGRKLGRKSAAEGDCEQELA